MGCDGGTIPKRDELVKTRRKKEQKDRQSERLYRWRHCAVSQTPLRPPIVACQLGRLYNKDEIITRLLQKTQEISNIGHIKRLKDVKELQLTDNPAYEGSMEQLGGESVEDARAPYICPVSALEMNGKHGFALLWGCGCVLSSRALKEIKSNACGKCGAPYTTDDIVVLNPNDEQLALAFGRMEERKKKAKETKKEKQDGKRKSKQLEGDATTVRTEEKVNKKMKTSNGVGNSQIAAGVAGSSKGTTSVSGLATSILRGSEFSSVCSKNYSIANDPKHSDVYKSIFDTHNSAKNKISSNWVTCNPQYY